MAKVKDYITYKCKCCKKDIPIIPSNFNNIVYRHKAYYHKECYMKLLDDKIQNSKTNANRLKWQERKEDILNERDDETALILKENYYKDQVCKFILNNYHITIIPTYLFIKLDSIYYGTFKGMNGVKISPDDLLYMWNKMMPKLIKIYQKNLKIGKRMDEAGRINYDLAILVSKYDSYSQWKAKQERLNDSNQSGIDVDSDEAISKYDHIAENNSVNDDGIDIVGIVDDIFGDEI